MSDTNVPDKVFKIDRMSDDDIILNAKRYRKESYSWTKDMLTVYKKYLMYIDGERTEEICTHFDCDLSEFREWLNERRKQEADNGDSD